MTDFNKVYTDLLEGNIKCEDIGEILSSPDVKKSINAYINKDKINKLVPYSSEDMLNIFFIVNIAQFVYNNSGCSTGLTDTEYDKLYEALLFNSGEEVISAPVTGSKITYHTYPSLRGTLTKTFYLTNDEERTNPSRRYLDEWKSTMENKILNKTGNNVDLDNYEVYVFPKFDGVSCVFELDSNGKMIKALTRGYTETNEAQDISHVFKNIHDRQINEFGKGVEYGLKTEIMMKEEDLDYFNKTYKTNYKNSRSIVSAILNSDEYDPAKSQLLEIVPLRVGDKDGNQQIATEAFDFPYLKCRLKDRERIREFAYKHKYVNEGLRCDGAVIYIIDEEIQKVLGRENNKNNWEVAYKFTEESEFSELIDITFNVGLFGRLAPVAKVKPVKLKGNTIENISLGSVARMKNLELRKGDKVKILYDIIPYLSFDTECEHNLDEEIIPIPSECPECGNELQLSENEAILSCINPDCPCRQKGKILNYLNKMDIDGISYGVIDKLYENDIVRNIKDLYKMNKRILDIVNIDGFGEKMVMSWLDEIDSHRQVPDYVLLGSLGIESVGRRMFKKITEEYNLDELLDIIDNKEYSKLIQLSGIKDKTAKKIIDGLSGNLKLIKFLEKELNIIESKGLQKSNFTVCFTKVRDKEKEEFIRNMGGEPTDDLKKSTTFLVVPGLDISSSKVTKAKKYNIPVIPIDELEDTIKEYVK